MSKPTKKVIPNHDPDLRLVNYHSGMRLNRPDEPSEIQVLPIAAWHLLYIGEEHQADYSIPTPFTTPIPAIGHFNEDDEGFAIYNVKTNEYYFSNTLIETGYGLEALHKAFDEAYRVSVACRLEFERKEKDRLLAVSKLMGHKPRVPLS